MTIAGWFAAQSLTNFWLLDHFGTNAAVIPYAHFFGTILLLSIGIAFIFISVSFIALVFHFLFMMPTFTKYAKNKRGYGFIALTTSALLATLTWSKIVVQLPYENFGIPILSAIRFTFDASSAKYCNLIHSEPDDGKKSNNFVRALFLTTTQEKALIIKRNDKLLDPIVLSEIIIELDGSR